MITSWIIAFFVTLSGVSGTVGATTLSEEQLASHAHYGRYINIVNDSAGYQNGMKDSNRGYGNTGTSGGSQPHTHSLSGTSGQASSLPPYHALVFIMRIA